MLYQLYDLHHAALTPVRIAAEATHTILTHPLVPASYTHVGRSIAAAAAVLHRTTRRFGKPVFGLPTTEIGRQTVAVTEEIVERKPFCDLIHFKRDIVRDDPKVLIVAPLSGHFATLLRGTVGALLPHHEVYITDWIDARQVPLSAGAFDLDSYIDYVREFLTFLGPNTHVIAVCQPAIPVFCAAALMAADDDPCQPTTMSLFGGPIDTRAAPTVVTELAENKPLSWFKQNVISTVPFYYPGGLRQVYPGFVQLTGFMTMNLDRHIDAHIDLFNHLVEGDGEGAEAHRRFYDEYLAVMDLPAEFYLQTVERVFQKQLLAKGQFFHRDRKVEPEAITKTALMTVEGELDDICAPGQTTAAHRLVRNLPADRHDDHLQHGVGHYGIFNGRRWRTQVMPRVRSFMRRFDPGRTPVEEETASNLICFPSTVNAA